MSSSGKIIQRSGKEKLSSIITDLHYRFTESLPKLCMAQTMNGKLEHFFVNEGCFNENYELAYELYVGQEAVLHRARFFEL